MSIADTFSLYNIDSFCQDVKKQIANTFIQKINLVDIQNSSMSLCKKAWLENCCSRFYRLLNIDRPY